MPGLLRKASDPKHGLPDLIRGKRLCERGHARVADASVDNGVELPVAVFVGFLQQRRGGRVKLQAVGVLAPSLQTVAEGALVFVKEAALQEVFLGWRKGVASFRCGGTGPAQHPPGQKTFHRPRLGIRTPVLAQIRSQGEYQNEGDKDQANFGIRFLHRFPPFPQMLILNSDALVKPRKILWCGHGSKPAAGFHQVVVRRSTQWAAVSKPRQRATVGGFQPPRSGNRRGSRELSQFQELLDVDTDFDAVLETKVRVKLEHFPRCCRSSGKSPGRGARF